METKELDEMINSLIAIRPFVLYCENMEYLNGELAYEFGRDLGERLGEDEFIPTFQEATKLYHDGLITKLKEHLETLVYICENTAQEIIPGLNFSVKSCEAHVRAAARIAAYYTVIQLYLRHPSITLEKVRAKLGQEFYDSLMKYIGRALSLKYVQKFIYTWGILNMIDETATKIEQKLDD